MIYDSEPKAYMDMGLNGNNVNFIHKKKISSPNLQQILNGPRPTLKGKSGEAELQYFLQKFFLYKTATL